MDLHRVSDEAGGEGGGALFYTGSHCYQIGQFPVQIGQVFTQFGQFFPQSGNTATDNAAFP